MADNTSIGSLSTQIAQELRKLGVNIDKSIKDIKALDTRINSLSGSGSGSRAITSIVPSIVTENSNKILAITLNYTTGNSSTFNLLNLTTELYSNIRDNVESQVSGTYVKKSELEPSLLALLEEVKKLNK